MRPTLFIEARHFHHHVGDQLFRLGFNVAVVESVDSIRMDTGALEAKLDRVVALMELMTGQVKIPREQDAPLPGSPTA